MIEERRTPFEDKGPWTPVAQVLRDLWTGVLDLVYPPKCVVCGEMQRKYLCDTCLAEIALIDPPVCSRCGAPVQEDRHCSECSGVDFAFDSARAVGEYDGVLKEAIHRLKYSGQRVLVPILGALLVEYVRRHASYIMQADCIVPVPIHPARRKRRGFNQSELLANEVGRVFGLPVVERAVVRARPTQSQIDLPREKRHENVEDAFRVVMRDGIAGRRVVLIDDVFTTGSTVDSASRALRDAGAREIHVFTLARSLR